MDFLEDNIKNVKKRIREAALRVNRNPDEITLVAVTKTIDCDIIKNAVNFGIENLGENRVQELMEKHKTIGNNVKWHLIGHLQTNKVKYIIDKVKLIHSVDSLKLAKEIDKRAAQIGKVVDILVQVNVSGEVSKFGIDVKQCDNLIMKLSELPNIRVKGLMTIAPNISDRDLIRKYFRQLKNLAIDIEQKNYKNITMQYLSMGMSGDFEIAIEEGANIVRVGRAIFGSRKY